jgi:hypothetical protein
VLFSLLRGACTRFRLCAIALFIQLALAGERGRALLGHHHSMLHDEDREESGRRTAEGKEKRQYLGFLHLRFE